MTTANAKNIARTLQRTTPPESIANRLKTSELIHLLIIEDSKTLAAINAELKAVKNHSGERLAAKIWIATENPLIIYRGESYQVTESKPNRHKIKGKLLGRKPYRYQGKTLYLYQFESVIVFSCF